MICLGEAATELECPRAAIPVFDARRRQLSLTVLIPAFNEASTIGEILNRVSAIPYQKQVIVVDDGSQDGTGRIAEQWPVEQAADDQVLVLRHAENRGKGAAIRSGLEHARGEITIIQDADLEYDPKDYPALVERICLADAQVVYGSRTQVAIGWRWSAHRLCRRLLNVAVFCLFGRRISDESTCYKAFRTDLLRRLDLRCRRFEFCPEVTAKLCRLGIPIHEVPIHYQPRSAAEGKKIGWRDAVEAFWTLVYWRFAPVKLLEAGAQRAEEVQAGETPAPQWQAGATPAPQPESMVAAAMAEGVA